MENMKKLTKLALLGLCMATSLVAMEKKRGLDQKKEMPASKRGTSVAPTALPWHAQAVSYESIEAFLTAFPEKQAKLFEVMVARGFTPFAAAVFLGLDYENASSLITEGTDIDAMLRASACTPVVGAAELGFYDLLKEWAPLLSGALGRTPADLAKWFVKRVAMYKVCTQVTGAHLVFMAGYEGDDAAELTAFAANFLDQSSIDECVRTTQVINANSFAQNLIELSIEVPDSFIAQVVPGISIRALVQSGASKASIAASVDRVLEQVTAERVAVALVLLDGVLTEKAPLEAGRNTSTSSLAASLEEVDPTVLCTDARAEKIKQIQQWVVQDPTSQVIAGKLYDRVAKTPLTRDQLMMGLDLCTDERIDVTMEYINSIVPDASDEAIPSDPELNAKLVHIVTHAANSEHAKALIDKGLAMLTPEVRSAILKTLFSAAQKYTIAVAGSAVSTVVGGVKNAAWNTLTLGGYLGGGSKSSTGSSNGKSSPDSDTSNK